MARVAVLVAEDFQDSELRIPVDRLRGAGHDVETVGLARGTTVRGKLGEETVRIDRSVEQVSAALYDALVIPGGGSPAHLRKDQRAVDLVREFVTAGKPVAAVCHGPELLVEAGVVSGRELTSWPEVRPELEEAGARWIDRAVVEDENLITSRKPEDLEAFSHAIIMRLVNTPEPHASAHLRSRSG